MKSACWISAHIFYHDDLTSLLTGCVEPLIEELRRAGLVSKYFFIRYWQGGPHVRLRLLPASQAVEEQIRQQVEEKARAFFSAHPSLNEIDERAYNRATEQFSRLEYQEDRRIPLYPNNSLRYIPYVPEYERYGGREIMPAIETHFMRSSDLALDLLRKGLNRNQLTSYGMAVFLLSVALGGMEYGYLAEEFAKHFSVWNAVSGEAAEQMTAQFEHQYQQQQEKLRRLAFSLLHMARQQAVEQSDLPAARWFINARGLYRQLVELDEAQALRTGYQFSQITAPMNILRSCVHMHSNRLGISVLEEAYILFLLKRLTQEIAVNERTHR